MSKHIISDSNLPFSDVVIHDGLAFVSGQIAFDESLTLVGDDIESQTRQTIANLKKVIEDAGLSFKNITRTGCYLTNWEDMAKFNEIYKEYFPNDKPA
jgi:2-iminobutanoate/2-iminopropanoate deaminase